MELKRKKQNMAGIVRKSGQIIFRQQPPIIVSAVATFLAGSILAGFSWVISRPIKSLYSRETIEISCNKIEPKLIDCQLTRRPMLGIFPPSTETYKGIKRVREFQEVGKHYVIFTQTSGESRVEMSEDRAQWVFNQVNKFMKSEQKILKQTNKDSNQKASEQANKNGLTVKIISILGMSTILAILSPFIFLAFRIFLTILKNMTFYQSTEINSDLSKVVITCIGIPLYRKTLNFSDIRGLSITKRNAYYLGFESGIRYYLEICTSRNKRFYFWSTPNEEEANNLVHEMCELIGVCLSERRINEGDLTTIFGMHHITLETRHPLVALAVIVPLVVLGSWLIIFPLSKLVNAFNRETLELSCRKIEPRLVDCQIVKISKLVIFPSVTETYKGIRGVKWRRGTLILDLVSGNNTVSLNEEHAQWVASEIRLFLVSSQDTLKQTNTIGSGDDLDIPSAIIFIFMAIIGLLVFWIVSNIFLYKSISINSNLGQVVETFIGIYFYKRIWSFSDIKGLVFIEIESSFDDDERTYKSYRLEIHTNKDKKIYIWSTSKQEEANNLANEICRLTGFRLIEQRLPSSETS